ncbi:MAG: hypothetical protein MI924_04680, partial [Chloroflexales bacterium]|nr:hypothetical protein [Chloroflexales bacterium]
MPPSGGCAAVKPPEDGTTLTPLIVKFHKAVLHWLHISDRKSFPALTDKRGESLETACSFL